MNTRVLLVMDMLNDFIAPEGALYSGEKAQQIVPFVLDKVNEFVGEGQRVLFVMDFHLPDDLEFTRFPCHCVAGTPGAGLIPELEELVTRGLFFRVKKNRFSAFHETDLEAILRGIKPEEVHIVGVCTNIGVLYTVEELCNRNYRVVVYRDGVASFDPEAHRWALQQMETVLGAKVV